MTVYVDPLMDFGLRLGKSCHLTTDFGNEKELHDFARRLGLKAAWFQPWPRASIDHYDLTAGRRKKAVAMGAVEQDRATSVAHWKAWQEARRRGVHLPLKEIAEHFEGNPQRRRFARTLTPDVVADLFEKVKNEKKAGET